MSVLFKNTKKLQSYKLQSYIFAIVLPWQKLNRSVSIACIRTERKGLPDGAEDPRTPCARGVRNFLQKTGKNRGAKKSDFGHFICICHKICVPLQCIWRCIAMKTATQQRPREFALCIRFCTSLAVAKSCNGQSGRRSAQSGRATKTRREPGAERLRRRCWT